MKRSRCPSAVTLALLAALACAPPPAISEDLGRNILANPSFDAEAGGRPAGWDFKEGKFGDKGRLSVVPGRSGNALRLAPSDRNTDDLLAFNTGQGFSLGPFKGKTLKVSGWLAAEGGATAILGAYTVSLTGAVQEDVSLAQRDQGAGFARVEGELAIPSDSKGWFLVVTCAVHGKSGAALFDDVEVTPVGEASAPAPAPAPGAGDTLAATIAVNAARTLRPIPRTLYGQNLEWIHGGSMIFDFRTDAFHPDIVRLTRALGTTLLRWPGGTFADFYHWRDGIGPREKRPEREPMTGRGKSVNLFGTDEAREFAKRVGADMMFTVNMHTGTPEEAADWVRYVNGHPGGARVAFWELGNEFYIKNDDPSNAAIPPDEYVRRYDRFLAAMKQADPAIRTIAIGAENYGRYNSSFYPDWNRVVLSELGGRMDYLALHNAYQPAVFDDRGRDVRTVYTTLLGSTELIRRNLETVAQQIERYAGPGSDVKLAITEWGPIFHVDPKNKWVAHPKTLGSALFAASTLHAFLRVPRVEVANAFKLVEPGFQGWIQPVHADVLTRKPAEGEFAPTAPYLAMQLYTQHFGTSLVESNASGPAFDTIALGMADAVRGAPYLDVVASRSADGRTLYVMAVNRHFDAPIRARIQLAGFVPRGGGRAWTLGGTGIDAHTGTQLPTIAKWGKQIEDRANPRFSKGGPGEVTLDSQPLAGAAPSFEYTFPPHSVTSLEIPGGGA